MVSVMNNDFDLERGKTASASEAEEFRVSNDGDVVDNSRDEEVSDLHLNDEIRVSNGRDLGAWKNEVDEVRVLEGHEREKARVLRGDIDCHTNGDSGNSGEVEGVRVALGNDGVDSGGEIEVRVKKMESGDEEDEVVSPEGGFISTSNGVRPADDDGMREKVVKEEASKIDSRHGDFKSETRGYMQASVSKDASASDVDDEMSAGSLKVMGSKFEMGDMVWGKVKSHPWWPGHLFNEAFATTSVRRTRRHGHILVAFFGDSSYGWFDLTELVPYDPHYAEKSQQTTSRTFTRAVEESIDEASRRSALGVTCCCRNPNNFRPANVPGYVAVDVVDYEPGAIYSLAQIRKARDSFHPVDTLSFIKQMAVTPMNGESKNLDIIKNKATTLAYRRSVFEEFDETYAQAFSQQPVRPSEPPAFSGKQPSRAPLSGPLVMADTLGGRKSSTKATKTKEQSKKDRYLFKRRDEAVELKAKRSIQGDASSSLSSTFEDGASNTAAAAYVLQKRDLADSNNELSGSPTRDQVATSAHAGSAKEAPTAGLGVMSPSGLQALDSNDAVMASSGNVHDKVQDRHISVITSSNAGQAHQDGTIKKKKKANKRSAGEQSSERSDRPEKKLKRKKIDARKSIEHVDRDSVASRGAVKSAGISTEIVASSIEDFQVKQSRKDDEATNSDPLEVGLVSPGVGSKDAELSQMLADLRGLALNPVHGIERNVPAITRQFFLKFRSSVFVKSSSALIPAESEPNEARASKYTSASESADIASSESTKAVKMQKVSARNEDPVKGRKRIPSERQEENAVKRAKKITEVKSLSAEKRALLKNPEIQQRPEGKSKVAAAQIPQSKPMKSEKHEKKVDRPPKVEEPTYLIMKFPSGSSLPSLVELKARFARFGPLDTTLSRVFYTTNTCRVAFLYKQDANVAHRYAMGSKSVFSNVRFLLKPVSAPEPQQPSSGRVEDVQSESTANKDSAAAESRPVVPITTPQHPAQQLKSCLKKPSGGDETGGPNNGGGNSRTPRVRFNMGEVKSSTDDNRGGLEGQKMESRNSMLSSYEGSSSSSSSSVAMDVSNNQRFNISSHQLQPPLLPHPPQIIRPPMNHQYHMVELSPRNNLHDNPRVIPPPPLPENQAPPQPTRDISQQMMNLLTRCHDVVTNVKSMLGYVPYHPL
ncbi:PWWP domain-containing protein 1 [Beta vulgaris subsp. vulgaris]|uniref:PWWP domain-containing protein 1 n=1 Tax=Beta vulgaris subsp. vulgaris TaxID=3555 RepID=UPI002036B0B5|nr:PWWP domain-containing protein 1 [Beta vulgaris subsp. vulgaris]